jgi:protein-lysine N-methyltransferase EEF2KMT
MLNSYLGWEQELNGNLVGLYTLYMSSPKLSVRDRVPVTYKPPVFPTTCGRNLETVEVTLMEAPNLISYVGTTGHRTWEAALAIGEHMLLSTHPSYESNIPKIDATGKIVLELGAGTGFVSILAAKMGAKKVWTTDGDEGVTSTAAENIEMNDVGDVAEATVRKWGIDTNLKGSGEIDIIVGADVVSSLSKRYDIGRHGLMTADL